MKTIWSFVSLLLISCFLMGCNSHEISGNGKVVSVVKEVPNFSRLTVNGDYSLKIIVGKKQQKVTVSADENLMSYIKFNLANDKLEIIKEPNVILKPTKRIEINIEVQNLSEVSLLGSQEAAIDAKGSTKFQLGISGTSKINLAVKTSELKINALGNSEILAFGTSNKLLIDSNGTSTIKAKSLMADNVAIKSLGGAKIEVYAEDELVLDISGSGSVDYYGKPKVTQKISGAVEISNKKNAK